MNPCDHLASTPMGNPQVPHSHPKPRVLSGVAATGSLHIGNYTGAIRPWAQGQDKYENFFFIADLHALTIPEAIHPKDLLKNMYEGAALLLACGIDPKLSVIFLQSQVPAHTTLGWLFNCLTPVSWLERMTQYKSKSQHSHPSAGLLTYPTLQSADILLYKANFVPVGDDQRQHIELTRDIALRFNNLFGELFTPPEAMIPLSGARIMGLDEPSIKMSKSVAAIREGHAIRLLDSPDVIYRSIARAVTDSRTAVDGQNLSPGVDNLLNLYEALTGSSRKITLEKFEGKGYGILKKELANVVTDKVGSIQKRYAQIMEDSGYLDEVLMQGAERAAKVADATLAAALHLVGLRR